YPAEHSFVNDAELRLVSIARDSAHNLQSAESLEVSRQETTFRSQDSASKETAIKSQQTGVKSQPTVAKSHETGITNVEAAGRSWESALQEERTINDAMGVDIRLDRVTSWHSLFRHRSLMFLTISYGAVGYIEYLFFFWMHYYFDDVLKLGKVESRVYAAVL